jgi:hypothetical protein
VSLSRRTTATTTAFVRADTLSPHPVTFRVQFPPTAFRALIVDFSNEAAPKRSDRPGRVSFLLP